MKKNLKYFRIFNAFLMVISWTSLSGAESLEDAWKISMDADHRLESARESSAAAEENLSAAKSLRLPSLKGEAAYTKLDEIPEAEIAMPFFPSMNAPLLSDESVFTSSVSVSLPVFTSGRISNAIDSAEYAAEAAKSDQLKTGSDIKLEVAEAYISVLRAEKAVRTAASNVNSLNAHSRDVRNFFDKGLVAKNDVLAVNVALADARQTELQTSNRLDMARAAYNRLMGRSLSRAVCLDDISAENIAVMPEKNCEAMTREALEKRSEIRGLSHQAKAYGYNADSIRASALPQVMASGSFYHFDKTPLEEENIWAASLGVRWDVFDGGVTIHRARAEERKRAAFESRKNDAVSLIGLQVRQAWLNVQESVKRMKVAADALDQAEENLRVAKNRYIQEIGSNTEVLDAETLRVKSLMNRLNSIYDAVLADIRLKRAVGNL